jgi:hypothetical protein
MDVYAGVLVPVLLLLLLGGCEFPLREDAPPLVGASNNSSSSSSSKRIAAGRARKVSGQVVLFPVGLSRWLKRGVGVS